MARRWSQRFAIITDVHWWGEFSPEVSAGGEDFTFTFYGDDSGIPGNTLQESGGSLTEVTVNVSTSLDPVIFYSSIPDSPFSATGSAKYWLSIFDQASDASWVWLAANNAGNNSVQGINPGPPWNSFFNPWSDMAFQLTSDSDRSQNPPPCSLSVPGCSASGDSGRSLKTKSTHK